MDRQNARIHRVTLQVPAELLKLEQQYLRPLMPSLYATVGDDFTLYEVKGMPYVRYRTNKYAVPGEWRYKSVKYKVVNEVLHIYALKTGEKIIQYPVDSRKNVIISSPEIKREGSTAWQGVAASLRSKYWTHHLDHFIDGVCKENPRYRFEQLQAIERFLGKQDQIDRQLLEQVFSTCCERFAYRVSEFETIFVEITGPRVDTDIELFALDTKPIRSVKVQHRGMDSYARAFRKLATKPEGGTP